MKISLTHFQKMLCVNFFLYGFIFACVMMLLPTNERSVSSFLFYFIVQGGIMSYTMMYLEKKSLKKEGINVLNAETMDENQRREILTNLSKDDFYDFWNNSETYKVLQNSDGSIDVDKKYYTSEFKETINVAYINGTSPKMVFKSKPKRWFYNDLALIHRTIESVKNFAEERTNKEV